MLCYVMFKGRDFTIDEVYKRGGKGTKWANRQILWLGNGLGDILLQRLIRVRNAKESFFFFRNRFWKDARGRRDTFATGVVRASHARRPSLTLRFHPLGPDFSFDRSRACS